jgi:hypothetical protein
MAVASLAIVAMFLAFLTIQPMPENFGEPEVILSISPPIVLTDAMPDKNPRR